MTKTNIEWTDETWNPSVGCSRVSAGCEHCYAEGVAHRGMTEAHRGLTVLGKHGPRWNGTVRFLAERLDKPLRWRKPRRVFVNSMSDLFHESLTFQQIAAVFGVMASSSQHTFQVLTKRPERATEFFAWVAAEGDLCASLVGGSPLALACIIEAQRMSSCGELLGTRGSERWPLPNVWLGVSVEDQATADERIQVLRGLPAAVRWVSYEPALGGVDFSRFMWPIHNRWPSKYRSPEEARAAGAEVTRHQQSLVLASAVFLDWIVIGGESGPSARPFDLAWARSTIEQCRAAGVACFVKQLGARPRVTHTPGLGVADYDVPLADRKGGDMAEWPVDLRVREWPPRVSERAEGPDA